MIGFALFVNVVSSDVVEIELLLIKYVSRNLFLLRDFPHNF